MEMVGMRAMLAGVAASSFQGHDLCWFSNNNDKAVAKAGGEVAPAGIALIPVIS
jgi:hypothetical protein